MLVNPRAEINNDFEVPYRKKAALLFAIAVILFTLGTVFGSLGLSQPAYKSIGMKGSIILIAGGYVSSAFIAEIAGPIHSKGLLANEPKKNRVIEIATRVPRAILSTVFDLVMLPIAGILLLIAACRSNYDTNNPKKDRIPILQIHGSGFCEIEWVGSWPWLSKEQYGSVYTLNLDGLASNQHGKGIDDYAEEKIRAKIKAIQQATGQNKIILMGHSMGGLVASYYAENFAALDGIEVENIITIATPWHGAPLLNLQNEAEKPKRYKQMSENDPFLPNLRGQAEASIAAKKRNYYSIGSTTDFMVPGASSLLRTDDARNQLYTWLGHYGIILYPGTWLQVRSWLDTMYT
jgi:triacylglycerol lipase